MAGARDETWLLDDGSGKRGGENKGKAKRKAKPKKAGAAENGASAWLAVPDPEGQAEGPRTEKRRRSSPSRGGALERRRLVGKLRRAETDLAERDRRIAGLEDRVAELEAELGRAASRKPKASPKPKARAKARVKGKPKGGPRRHAGKLDANEVSFEELRDLGLSLTQSARLIAAREMRGGFTSEDELLELQGFSAATLKELQARLTV